MRGMAHPKSRSHYNLRQLKSHLSDVSSLSLAGRKSTGTVVTLWITHGNVTDVRLDCVPWATKRAPNGCDEQRFQKMG